MHCKVDGPLEINKVLLYEIFQREKPLDWTRVRIRVVRHKTNERGYLILKRGRPQPETIEEHVQEFSLSVLLEP